MSDPIEHLIEHYHKALLIKADHPEIYNCLAECYYKQGQIDEAIAAYNRIIELQPDHYKAYYKLGQIRENREQYFEAIYNYLKVIGCYQGTDPVDPIFSRAYKNLMNIKNKGSLSEAIRSHRQIIQERSDFVMAHVGLGDLLTQQGDLEAAISSYHTASYQNALYSHPDFVKNYWNDRNLRQPHFLIIGIGKGGTTSLYHYLGKHPQIIPALKKEILFFNQNISKGLDWYLAHFPPIPKDTNFLTGEATPWYLVNFNAEKEVANLFPQVKIIILLRNPVLRAFSQYQMRVKLEKEQRQFLEVITSEIEAINRLSNPSLADAEYWKREKGDLLFGLYVYFLEKWMTVFPREQFLILKSEDFYANPATTLTRVFEFLGVPDYPLPEYRNFNPGSYQPIGDDLRRMLADFFRPHNQKLEDYLGMKFNWD